MGPTFRSAIETARCTIYKDAVITFGRRVKNGRVEYCVHWRGYGAADDSARARPGRSSALSVLHSESALCGAICVGAEGA